MAKRTAIILNGTRHEPLASGDTLDANIFPLDTVRYVDAANGDDTYDGKSLLQPWKTLTYAAVNTPTGCTLYITPGTYTAPFIWTVENVDIIGLANRSSLVNITGAVEFNHTTGSVRIANIGITTLTHAGAGDFYTTGCVISAFTKSGDGYYEDNGSVITTSITVTGTNDIRFVGGTYCNTTVDNAAAFVSFYGALSIKLTSAISVVSGLLRISDSTVLGNATPFMAIQATATGMVFLTDSKIYSSNYLPAPVDIEGGTIITNVVLDYDNSTLPSFQTASTSETVVEYLIANIIRPVTGIVGKTTNTPTPASYVGEMREDNGAFTGTIVSGTDVELGKLTLAAGHWDVHAWVVVQPATGDMLTEIEIKLTPTPMQPNYTMLDNNRQGKVSYAIPLNRYITATTLDVAVVANLTFTTAAAATYYIAARRVI